MLKGLAGGVGATLATALSLRAGSAQGCQRQQQRCGGSSGSCCSGLTCVPDSYIRSGGRAGANRCCPPNTELFQDRCTQTALREGDARFVPCGFEGDTDHFFDVVSIFHPGGFFSASLRGADSGSGTLPDPYVFLYPAGGFDPANPCANLIDENDDGGCGLDSFLSIANLAAGNYTVLVTSFDEIIFGGSGTYTLEFGLPSAPACFTAAADKVK